MVPGVPGKRILGRSMGFNQAKTYEIALNITGIPNKVDLNMIFLLEFMETGKYVVFHIVSRNPSKQEIDGNSFRQKHFVQDRNSAAGVWSLRDPNCCDICSIS
jgi:hypothetical protein